MPSDSEKRRFSWRGFRKISAKLPILHALRHVCGIGGHTRTEKCLWRFSLQMHCNGPQNPIFLIFVCGPFIPLVSRWVKVAQACFETC